MDEVKSGQIKVLGVCCMERLPTSPDVPPCSKWGSTMNKPSHANPAGADYVGLLAAWVAAGHGEVVARLQPTVSDGGRDYAHVSRRDFRQSRAETGSPQTASTASQSRQRADIVSEFDPVRAPSPLRFPLGGCAGYAIDCVRGGIGGPAIAATVAAETTHALVFHSSVARPYRPAPLLAKGLAYGASKTGL